MTNSAESFSATYAEARTKFREAAAAAGAKLEHATNPAKGPDGGELTTDIAWIGPRDAQSVLVTISGTHGVEGFCGSGAQIDWLRRGEAARLPKDTAALLIHAINPFGFAWLRRTTEENVDLNRNWIDFASPPANEAYDKLRHAIVPERWTDESRKDADAALAAYATEHGFAALQAAVSAGQYGDPRGVFYGGAHPSWSRRTQSAILGEYLKNARNVAIIDYHTGLGPWGYAEQIVPLKSNSEAFHRAASWYGCAITSPVDGSSSSADIKGDGLSAASTILSHSQVTVLALEFGTVEIMQTLAALRADAWLHAHGDLRSPQGRAIKAEMRNAFYGDADDWKGMIAGQSLVACRSSVAGLKAA
ncbi:MAG: M14 family metallopeptidase [Rhizomicrobium sp.]|jgi:hypothetical protein